MQPRTLQEAIIYFSNYVNCHEAVKAIRWPDGVREKLTVPAVNRILTVVEGKGFSEPSK